MDADSSTKFIGSLTKFLQSLCNGYVEFQRGVELVGHIYLSIDTGEKVDYILHEKVSKNDENSVTFVSNSFHAQPLEKDKDKTSEKNASAKSSANVTDKNSSDEDDIMIVDQPKRVPASSNTGSISSRGMKREASSSSSQRQAQRICIAGSSLGHSQGSNNRHLTSPSGVVGSHQHSGTATTPSATHQENINIDDVKLEQISNDELLTLATQVDEGGSRPRHSTSSASRSHPQHTGEGTGWIKQEAAEDSGGGNDAGWSQGRDDSNSNSGSNLYPVMLHQSAAYSNPGFSGHNPSGSQSVANPYSDPIPGTSQDASSLDPSGETDFNYPPLNVRLPEFSAMIRIAIEGSDVIPRWTWLKVVREAAKFYMLSYPSELNNTRFYQSIGQRLYERYPCIGDSGKRPWSKFTKCLSQKIRRLRYNRRSELTKGQRSRSAVDDAEAETHMQLDPDSIDEALSPEDAT